MAKIFGTHNEREMKKLRPRVERINALEPEVSKLSDVELRAKTDEFRRRVQERMAKLQEPDSEEMDADRRKLWEKEQHAAIEEVLEELLEEAFAVVREAGKRALNMRHFDVQLIGGMVLHSGRIAEMKTGEGKTLVATLPVYLNSLAGRGVHVVTVNDYLAEPENWDLKHHVEVAVKAHQLYRRDVEYVVKDGEVLIVDEFTGRLMPGRRWSDGLHQAVEAKEGVK